MNGAFIETIELVVNHVPVADRVEPRTSLADFLREQRMLCGTNIGCEQGVCGACTIDVDGVPTRSCITPAISCASSAVRTIEGFDDDRTMNELRAAFTAEHALQCGYCTAGMLVTARDIVTRLPDADDARVRLELSGNLCRCTGYVGIVRAIRRVLDARLALTAAPAPLAVTA
ncbi:(2Fe-2S)-binding protein [Paraburkholderia sp. ZP32-5]|uniref:(2Fe-2S)-binding protein n=1 Tax=Paraburkholderia sp. ZP32-5 TaxID=2883245 RepID=UPI001F233CE8|nr:(2Fe-2S)-binding protein [Paraburkholderia sp. ZP32-5]